MRDRLIELVSKAREKCNLTNCCDCEYRDAEPLTNCYSYLIADHLLANGVIVPPCKVGDTVWIRWGIHESTKKIYPVKVYALRYDTKKNKKNDPDRIEMKKYCRFCREHTLHKETK